MGNTDNQDFSTFLTYCGVDRNTRVIADGKWHHCRESGSKKKPYSYVLNESPFNHGTLMDMRTGHKFLWCGGTDEKLDRAKHVELRYAQMKKTAEEHAAARAQAREICLNSNGASHKHPYLVRKQVKPYNLLQSGDVLIVPIRSVEGTVQSIERIFTDGTKKYLKGGMISGNFYSVGVVDLSTVHRVLICEGVATAHCLFEAVGLPTIAAMSAGNLEAVGRVIRKVAPVCKIIFAADDDWQTKGNPGMAAAAMAAEATDGRFTCPKFTGMERGVKDTDYNDLQLLAGLEEVRRQIIWAL